MSMPAPRIAPEKLPALYELGDRAIVLRKLDEAQWCFERAMEIEPDAPRPYMGLAQAKQLQGQGVLGRALLMDALRRGADPVETYVMLGRFFQFDGDFEQARTAFARAAALDPAHGHAQLGLALLPTDDADAQVAALEKLRTLPSLEAEHRATLDFALARALDTKGDYDAAFAAYTTANDARRAQYPDRTDMPGAIRRLRALFTAEFLAARRTLGDPTERPVFVVGMMRSGTSLIEQILDCHPLVHGHGERNGISMIGVALQKVAGTAYPECLATLDATAAGKCAANYLAACVREAPDALRNIDKLPHNYEHLGLIALLFPNARIIHCERDPLDVCLSNYFHDFGEKNTFTYDLATMGRHYRDYETLMAHWAQVLPNPMLTIRYEDVVADQEGWSRRAVAFLGLDWDPACLAYHENKRPVFTKSVWQVRQPIYDSSIGRWRRYRRHLGPLFAALEMTPPE